MYIFSYIFSSINVQHVQLHSIKPSIPSNLTTMSAPRRKERIAFVTIGASASFQPLIAEVLSPDFIAKLRAARFTHLIVQYGPDLRCFDAAKPAPEGLNDNNSLIVTGFAYKESLRKEMELTTAKETSVFVREKGLIVTHAGRFVP